MPGNQPVLPPAKGALSHYHMHLSALARMVGGFNYRYGNEVQLHEALAEVLTMAGYAFEREYVLDAKNRADFWLDGLVIEVKVDGALSEALRQVDRYIALPQVKGVLLASTQRWAAQQLDARPAWQGKPFQMVRLGRQAL